MNSTMTRHGLRFVPLLVAMFPMVSACMDPASDAEKKMRAKVVGDYVIEDVTTNFEFRQVLTLRQDSRWTRVTTRGGTDEWGGVHTDSGNYRIQGVTINLHSEIDPQATPYRYTFSGDTLYQANAAQTYAITGVDIGEQIMVRER